VKSQIIAENSALLMQFRQFTSELIAIKRRMEQMFPPEAEDSSLTQQVLAEKYPTLETETERARLGLMGMLEQQSMRVQDLGGALGYSLYREAEFVMASLADEMMLNGKWAGRLRWKLLEEEIFQTHASGEIFFSKLDRLLAANAVASRELAMIYLQALALDFRGKFRGKDAQNQLEHYRRQLYDRVFQRAVEREPQELLFPQSYTIETEAESPRLLSPRNWWFVVAATVVVWLLASTLLWQHVATLLQSHLQRIEAYSISNVRSSH
jgi:type VI secretion system protein ImpK